MHVQFGHMSTLCFMHACMHACVNRSTGPRSCIWNNHFAMCLLQGEPHPALELFQERLQSGSKPGKRKDRFKLGLAVEGGGMRGSVTAGMLRALHALGARYAHHGCLQSPASRACCVLGCHAVGHFVNLTLKACRGFGASVSQEAGILRCRRCQSNDSAGQEAWPCFPRLLVPCLRALRHH